MSLGNHVGFAEISGRQTRYSTFVMLNSTQPQTMTRHPNFPTVDHGGREAQRKEKKEKSKKEFPWMRSTIGIFISGHSRLTEQEP